MLRARQAGREVGSVFTSTAMTDPSAIR